MFCSASTPATCCFPPCRMWGNTPGTPARWARWPRCSPRATAPAGCRPPSTNSRKKRPCALRSSALPSRWTARHPRVAVVCARPFLLRGRQHFVRRGPRNAAIAALAVARLPHPHGHLYGRSGGGRRQDLPGQGPAVHRDGGYALFAHGTGFPPGYRTPRHARRGAV